MSVITKDLGAVSAYGLALEAGFEGTEQEYAELLASYGTVAQEAADSAGRAAQAANATGQLYGQTATARDAAISAKNDAVSAKDTAAEAANVAGRYEAQAESAKTDAESARDTAVNAVDGFAAGAQQALDSVNEAGGNWKSLAEKQAGNSEAWAVGQRGGVDVPTTDATYHNNAKYYAEQASGENTSAQTARQGAETAATNAGQSATAAATSASAAAESARTLTIDTTLTQSGQAADAKVVGERFDDISTPTSNRFNLNAITANQYIAQDGTVTASNNFSVTDFIPVEEGEKLYFRAKRQDGAFYSFDARFLCAYDTNKTAVAASGGAFVGGTYTVPSGTAFIRLSISNEYLSNYTDFYVGIKNVNTANYEPWGRVIKVPASITDQVSANTKNITANASDILSLESEINGFNSAITSIFSGTDYVEKTYVNMEQGAIVAGNESDSTTVIRSGYIANDDLTFNYDNTIYKIDVIRYDSNKTYVGHTTFLTISPLKLSNYSITDPFVRIILARQNGGDISPANLVYTTKTIDNNIAYTNSTAYTVTSGGSILQGLKHCYDNGIKKLIVEAGTYDVIADYQSVYGADYFDNYAGYATSDPFDRGLWLENIEVVFSAGAKVVCKYTGNNTSVLQNFSAFATGNNVTIDGLVLDAENLRYGIHADYNSGAAQTYFIVRNCDLRHYKSETSLQAIGAGLGRHVLWIFENTIFRSDANHICVRIHNNVNSDAQSKIIVRNCYIDGDGYFRFNAYSTSELQTMVEVCGCSYKTPPVVGKETTASNENFTMLAWNNEIRSE